MADAYHVGMTLNYILDSSRGKFGDRPAVGMAMKRQISYTELHHHVITLAVKLMEMGVGKGDRVAILAENSPYWGMAYFSIVRLGAIVVPILPDLPESDIHHILSEMSVQVVFTTQRQVDKIIEKKDFSGTLVMLDDTTVAEGLIETMPLAEMLVQGTTILAEVPETPVFPEVYEDDTAAILYTSGTSGYSKAVILTHKNLTGNAFSGSKLMELEVGNVFLSILPLAHTYEFSMGFLLPLIIGCRIAYAGKTPTPGVLQKICQHEKPHIIFAVPLVLEKIYKKKILPQIEKGGMISLARRTQVGRKLIAKKIGARLVEFFGGNLKAMCVGGAALNPEVEAFFAEAEFPYLIGYGLTEASPLLAGGPFGDPTIAVGSTGKPIPGVAVKIVDPDPETGIGEIYATGPNIMQGYYDDEESTAEVLSGDGWLATGDLGIMDEQGNLHIKGRSKNVIIMANGENVYPEAIEHKMNSFSWVVESLVLEKNNQLEAWVYPDYEVIDEKTAGLGRAERRDFLEKIFEEMRVELNTQLSGASRVARILERREPFIKTATHKIKRYLYHSQVANNA